jgi:hypothetical protein
MLHQMEYPNSQGHFTLTWDPSDHAYPVDTHRH